MKEYLGLAVSLLCLTICASGQTSVPAFASDSFPAVETQINLFPDADQVLSHNFIEESDVSPGSTAAIGRSMVLAMAGEAASANPGVLGTSLPSTDPSPQAGSDERRKKVMGVVGIGVIGVGIALFFKENIVTGASTQKPTWNHTATFAVAMGGILTYLGFKE